MKIEENVPLKDHTTFRVGGPARFFAVAQTLGELRELFAHARDNRLPVLILGDGSNVLAPDKGWEGMVIKVALRGRNFREESDGRVIATAAAGESWDNFVADCVARGYGGLENLSGIPGLVGATPIQNVGAYGVEVKDVIEAVLVLDVARGELKQLTPQECKFGYRDSTFKKNAGRYVVTSVSFRLGKSHAPKLHYRDLKEYFAGQSHVPSLREIRRAVIAIRSRKFPDLSVVGTAGSFFKNPIIAADELARLQTRFPELPHFPAGEGKEKISLAWLLDRVCNLRGVTHGAVGAFEHQPLVIVNFGGATADDIRSFAAYVASCVKARTGIVIEPEAQIL